jgi:hypothetical protein
MPRRAAMPVGDSGLAPPAAGRFRACRLSTVRSVALTMTGFPGSRQRTSGFAGPAHQRIGQPSYFHQSGIQRGAGGVPFRLHRWSLL